MDQRAPLFTDIEVLLADQCDAWRAGRPKQVEQYLTEHPRLASDSQAILHLVHGEFRLRQELGQSPSSEEYCRRFPQYVDRLPPLFRLDRALLAREVVVESLPETVSYAPLKTAGGNQIGRYRLLRLLGEGGFGRVWLGHDEELQRQVAVKIPNPERLRIAEDAEAFLTEARTVAGLDHPHIIPVYDVGRTEEGTIYVVSKFVDGCNLAQKIREGRMTHAAAASLAATVAQALHYAHKKSLIHRDVTPSNILIDARSDEPFVADFGLAIREDDYSKYLEFAGTPAYMSPEQARGEGHRLDGRSDVFSTGVVLYELLTGKRPFRGATTNEVLHHIIAADPVPPRELERALPAELERICLKALAKRPSDRYSTAAEFADDLLNWRQEAGLLTPDVPIVPKGLRSFDAEDADFFLDLLPGPHNRDGLPQSIQFWKTRLEATNSDDAFSVGLILGPSGCGKSSMIKAGLLPRLAPDVTAIYVEATQEETEIRILRSLRKRVPGLAGDLGLVASFAALRRREGSKVVVILDQFEQWLHARPTEPDAELVGALRQCDGRHLQAVIMVRDDFSTAASRFMRELDVRIVEGHNFAAVDLFDVDHARKVLVKFGRSFGRLPASAAALSDEQRGFVDAVVDGLAEDGRVVSVRLALFSEMVKGKPWSPATLEQVGGTTGVGVNFLEETFDSRSANPLHRQHRQAARKVLHMLLPEAGTDIKGHMQSHAALGAASGYQHPDEFHELLRVLDGELRLITPTDPEGPRSESRAAADTKYYQLTHDYLVPSLREWLTRKQKETRRGRAELRLEERSALWNVKRENRQLPSLWEYLNTLLLTKRKRWTSPQRRMMAKATWLHAARWGTAFCICLIGAVGVRSYLAEQANILLERDRENVRTRAELLTDAVMTAPADAVSYAVKNLDGLREYAPRMLQARFDSGDADPAHRLRAAVVLAEFGNVQLDYLVARIADAAGDECANLVTALSHDRDAALSAIRARIDDADRRRTWPAKARLTIVALHLGDASPADDMLRLRPDPVQRSAWIEAYASWHGPVDQLVDVPSMETSAAFRSGVCLALGAIPATDLPSAQVKTAIARMLGWYLTKPDAGTHGAADWALRQWQVALPAPPSDSSHDDRQWQVNGRGMSMLRMPAGTFERIGKMPVPGDPSRFRERRQTVVLTTPFWIGDREISIRQFQQFLDDPAYPNEDKPSSRKEPDQRRSPTDDHPVQQVSWNDAVLFCNWLSRKEGRDVCYHRVDSGWQLIENAGYRLPLEAEWEFAARAGTTTRYASGDDESSLSRYAVVHEHHAAACGSKMPNAWGVFDAHGNVYEWCHDWYADGYGEQSSLTRPQGPTEGIERVLRGGAFDYEAKHATSSLRGKNDPEYRSYTIGFRIARSVP